jgi:major membrane immunogen (membrane-anchored lipoprotein)
MTEVSQSPSQEFYAVYSQKQFDNMQDIKENNYEDNHKFPYIYYKTDDNKLLQVTEIFHDKSGRSKYDDAIYLGKVKKFHSALIEPIITIQQKKYEVNIP